MGDIDYNKIIRLSNKSIGVYLLALFVVSILFNRYVAEWYIYIFGIVEVFLFFFCVPRIFKNFRFIKENKFLANVCVIAFVLRFLYVFIAYFFYIEYVGIPFEFGKFKDSLKYFEYAEMWYWLDFNQIAEKFNDMEIEFADSGYFYYLIILNKIFGRALIIFPRILHCVWGVVICYCIYQIAKRHFGEVSARMASLCCCFMPNLIFYCGLHNKEAVMVAIVFVFLDVADRIIYENKKSIFLLIILLLSILFLFMLRTVLGVIAIISFFMSLFLFKNKGNTLGQRVVVSVFVLVFISFVFSDRIFFEVRKTYLNTSLDAQAKNMEWRSQRGGDNANTFAKYAGASVFAPMIFTIPFPSVVYTPEQVNQRMIHGGNFVKNIMSGLCIASLFLLLKQWRKHSLLLFFLCGYLLILVFSNYSHSERFHLPIVPLILLFSSSLVVQMKGKEGVWVNGWLFFMFIAFVGWNWFKLAGRGLI